MAKEIKRKERSYDYRIINRISQSGAREQSAELEISAIGQESGTLFLEKTLVFKTVEDIMEMREALLKAGLALNAFGIGSNII